MRQQQKGDVADGRRQRRQRLRLRLAHRGDLSERLSAGFGGQYPAPVTGRGLPKFPAVPQAAGYRLTRRKMRALRISEYLRRLPRSRVRIDRRLPGGRSPLRVPARPYQKRRLLRGSKLRGALRVGGPGQDPVLPLIRKLPAGRWPAPLYFAFFCFCWPTRILKWACFAS